ncbi:MAG: Unknown protein [uncultured Sulfurovum sp.]|uniref:Uncharacterized protein n=1 Tax=uncultured Sulfurovum sp. TaxID=269237 RepID=A0A6S6RTW2_9BACT|nr:MAG: Unknown protein [uncultured Sulfurovum sp.]
MDYRIYDKKQLLNESINRRGGHLIFTLFFKINHFSFAVQYEPNYFISTGLSHFNFYALSKGFEEFTGTGYRSIFVDNCKKISSYQEVKDFLFGKLNEKIDLEKVSSKPIQLNLFEM